MWWVVGTCVLDTKRPTPMSVPCCGVCPAPCVLSVFFLAVFYEACVSCVQLDSCMSRLLPDPPACWPAWPVRQPAVFFLFHVSPSGLLSSFVFSFDSAAASAGPGDDSSLCTTRCVFLFSYTRYLLLLITAVYLVSKFSPCLYPLEKQPSFCERSLNPFRTAVPFWGQST